MAKRHHVAQHERVHVFQVSATGKSKNQIVGKQLPQEFARPQKIDVYRFPGDQLGLGIGHLASVLPAATLNLHTDLFLHPAVDGQTVHHPAEGVLPGQMTDFVKQVVPPARHEQHVEGNVNLIPTRAPSVAAAKSKSNEWHAGRNAEAGERGMDVPLHCDNQPAISAAARESESTSIVLELRDAVDRLPNSVFEHMTEIVNAVRVEYAV